LFREILLGWMKKRTRARFTLNLSDDAFYIAQRFGEATEAEVCIDVGNGRIRVIGDE
jgi:hypothetical protein